ncbi:MAG TPA: hypothetical protein VFU57_04925 [Candidatus Acidoferrales bacterium]|nr:hypothetical protein [Candidatus Acidoferrales bacterium]
MEPIIALLALIAQHSIRQEALIAALEKKGLLSRAEFEASMPKSEKDVGGKFDSIKTEFFELWSKIEDGAVQ